MSSKTVIYIGILLGTTIGGYIPIFWGGALFSFTSILLSLVGGFIGFFISYRLSGL